MAAPARKRHVTRQLIIERILQLADRYEVKFRNVMLAAVRIGQGVSIEKLAAAIRTGNEQAILGAIPWEDRGVPALQATLPGLTTELARAAARAAGQLLPTELDYRFDITNPVSVRHALAHSNKLVTEVTEETKAALRDAIGNAIQAGRPPLQAARDIRGVVGLRTDQVAFIERLRREGASERELERARDRKLRERTLLIARTETLWAANEGQRMLWEQAQDAGVVPVTAQREFVVTPDDRLCAVCEPLDGKQYGIDEQITTELGAVPSPPIHPNCRCTMSLVPGGREAVAPPEPQREPPPPAPEPEPQPAEEPAAPAPVPAPAAPPDPVAQVQEFEASDVRHQTYETAYAVGEDGQPIIRKDGNESSVGFTKAEMDQLRGRNAIFTHNHPNSSSFSPDDVAFAGNAQLREMRAFGKEANVLYRIERAVEPDSGVLLRWPGRDRVFREYGSAINNLNPKYRQRWREAPTQGAKDRVWMEHTHEAWTMISGLLGLKYTREIG
jgi:hypothetical protein